LSGGLKPNGGTVGVMFSAIPTHEVVVGQDHKCRLSVSRAVKDRTPTVIVQNGKARKSRHELDRHRFTSPRCPRLDVDLTT
jgi:hypothetical protein